MRKSIVVLGLVAALGLAGCATPDQTTGERTLTGAGVGAAAGAAVGLLTGGFLAKTAVGAAAGAAGGFVYDQIQKQR
jgi:outer membrane lipoprotein SlyB